MKYRIQTYAELADWKRKALPFLREKEGWNNLFWQIIENREKTSNRGWSGNVFCDGSIRLCGLHTPSNYLLLSQGDIPGVEALAKYSIRKKWCLQGVSGPESVVKHYLECRERLGAKSQSSTIRSFKLFQTCNSDESLKFEDYNLSPVSSIDWARARVWAQQFALEADPPMDISAITQMAKQMHTSKNLFMLTNPQNHPCAMAGFGRSTDRYRIINMLYVPKELRGLGLGEELITRMTFYARDLGFDDCLLFSEWKGGHNLYVRMGCKNLGKFAEYDLT